MSEYVEIGLEDIIKFKDLDTEYGRGEFVFCPVFRNGRMEELYITAVQQNRTDTRWKLRLEGDIKIFCIQSWGLSSSEAKLKVPWVWREWWCKDHKAIAHEVYVPDGANTLSFDLHFGDTLDIKFERRGNAEGK